MDVFKVLYSSVKRENNFVAKVLENLELVHKVLVEKKNEDFMSLADKGLLV